MKVKELLLESVTLNNVTSLHDLIDPKTGQYYTGEVNVENDVQIGFNNLTKFPVKFGTVSGTFNCRQNRLSSLEGAPRKVGENFYCAKNKLTTFKGSPENVGRIVYNENAITSLEGIHKLIKKMNSSFHIMDNPIESGGIGLLLIEGITHIYGDSEAFNIINRYVGQGKKGLLLCQEELIEAGLEEFAKL